MLSLTEVWSSLTGQSRHQHVSHIEGERETKRRPKAIHSKSTSLVHPTQTPRPQGHLRQKIEPSTNEIRFAPRISRQLRPRRMPGGGIRSKPPLPPYELLARSARLKGENLTHAISPYKLARILDILGPPIHCKGTTYNTIFFDKFALSSEKLL